MRNPGLGELLADLEADDDLRGSRSNCSTEQTPPQSPESEPAAGAAGIAYEASQAPLEKPGHPSMFDQLDGRDYPEITVHRRI